MFENAAGHNPLCAEVSAESGDPAEVMNAVRPAGEAAGAVDEMEVARRDKARSLLLASRFMSSWWRDDFLVMRSALQPQITLMSSILRMSSEAYEIEEMHAQATLHERGYPLVMLAGHARKALKAAARTVSGQHLWAHMPETESMRTQIWAQSYRAAAVLWQLIWQRLQFMPFTLFDLLENPSEASASRLRSTPLCMQDAFSRRFLQQYATEESLLSDSAQFVLPNLAAYVPNQHVWDREVARQKFEADIVSQPLQAHGCCAVGLATRASWCTCMAPRRQASWDRCHRQQWSAADEAQAREALQRCDLGA